MNKLKMYPRLPAHNFIVTEMFLYIFSIIIDVFILIYFLNLLGTFRYITK